MLRISALNLRFLSLIYFCKYPFEKSAFALSCLQLQRFISGGFAYIFTIFENFVFENCLRRELFCVAKRELIACGNRCGNI